MKQKPGHSDSLFSPNFSSPQLLKYKISTYGVWKIVCVHITERGQEKDIFSTLEHFFELLSFFHDAIIFKTATARADADSPGRKKLLIEEATRGSLPDISRHFISH